MSAGGSWAAAWRVLAPGLVAAYRFRARSDEKAAGWFEVRQGMFEKLAAAPAATAPRALVHVASVGEALMAMPVLAALAERGFSPVLSYTSVSFARNTPKNLRADLVTPSPQDTAPEVRRFLDLVAPRVIIFSTYDLWPGFTFAAAARGIPLALVNASLPAGSGRLGFPARLFYRRLYGCLSAVGAVAPEDAERFGRLGVADRTRVTGNCRFDQTLARCRAVGDDDPDLALVPPGETLVGGSVWPEDLARLLPALANLMERRPGLRAVLAPHEISEAHVSEPERFFAARGVGTVRWSALKKGAVPARVIVVDALGVLYKLYRRGTVAYVGGSFQQGIHSVMEPAGMGLPVLMGPKHQNSAEALEMERAGGAVAAADAAGLEAALDRWLADEAARRQAAGSALAVVERNSGATGRTMELIGPLLEKGKRER